MPASGRNGMKSRDGRQAHTPTARRHDRTCLRAIATHKRAYIIIRRSESPAGFEDVKE